tara:strand:+ start:17 stop:367 length:351 start_codon:yes stop_codon:yes gene_type:complete
MLENLLNSISSNPAYLAVTIVLMAMIAFSVIKRLFRLVVLGITLLIIYYAYIIFTGQPLPELDDIQNRVQKIQDTAKVKVEEQMDEIKSTVKTQAEKDVLIPLKEKADLLKESFNN